MWIHLKTLVRDYAAGSDLFFSVLMEYYFSTLRIVSLFLYHSLDWCEGENGRHSYTP
jgi:hypothetical protein